MEVKTNKENEKLTVEVSGRLDTLTAPEFESKVEPELAGVKDLVIDLKDTVDLDAFPLPSEGAYAQALYLLDHGFQPKPTHDESQLITEHNRRFEEPNDCEEAILTFLKQPDTLDNAESLSAGDIMRELSFKGFRGREYNSYSIGRAMKKLGYESKTIRGVNKYLVAKVDYDQHDRENKEDSKLFGAETF